MKNAPDILNGHVSFGIAGFGTYAPEKVVSAETLAQEANIPVEKLTIGIGVKHIHVANDDEHPFKKGLRDRYFILSFSPVTPFPRPPVRPPDLSAALTGKAIS